MVNLAVSLIIFFQITLITTNQWNLSDIKDITYATSTKLNAYCIFLMSDKTRPFEENPEVVKLATMLAKFLNEWHPLMGVHSFDEVVSSRAADHCVKPIFIVIENRHTKECLEKLSTNYQFTNSIWMIFLNSSMNEGLFKKVNLPLTSGLIVVEPDQQGNAILWEVFSVADIYPKRQLQIGHWSHHEGLVITAESMAKRRSNLGGHLLRTASLENWPVTSFIRKGNSKGRLIDGFFAKVWFDLEKIMNFVSINLKSAEEVSGRQLDSGEWNGLLGMADRGEVDVLLTEMSMSPRRLKVVEFIQPLIRTRQQVYFRHEGFVMDWTAVFRPFTAGVWLAIAMWIVVGSLALWAIDWTSIRYCFRERFTVRPFKLLAGFFFVVQALCNQATNDVPRGNTLRCLFLLCYLTGTIILTSYSAALISALTHKNPVRPFDSLQEMLREKTPLLVWSNTADFEMFSKATDPLYKALFAQVNPLIEMQELRGYQEMYQYMCNNSNVAMFGVETNMDVVARLQRAMSDKCVALKFTQGLTPAYQTMAFPRKSPYRELVNYNLLRMRETGLLSRWRRQYFFEWVPIPESPKLFVGIPEVAPLFIIWIAGTFLSLIILFGEIYFKSHGFTEIYRVRK